MPLVTPWWVGPNTYRFPTGLVETVRSGVLTLGQKVTYHQEWEGMYSNAFQFALMHPRGSIWTFTPDNVPSQFFVEECRLKADKGGRGIVEIDYIYTGVVPPDEFACTPFEDSPAIERNPYFSTSYGNPYGYALTDHDLQQAKATFEAETLTGAAAVQGAISASDHADLINDLVTKWRRGETNYYRSALKFIWSTYSYNPGQWLWTKGGTIEDPTGPFAQYAPDSYSWLRQSDEITWNDGLWKLTCTWLGGQVSDGDGNGGDWDTDLYKTIDATE